MFLAFFFFMGSCTTRLGLAKCFYETDYDLILLYHKESLCPNTSGMLYWLAMEDRQEQQLVLLAECCLSCIARVSLIPAAATQR